jgi:hypothetical protein
LDSRTAVSWAKIGAAAGTDSTAPADDYLASVSQGRTSNYGIGKIYRRALASG